MLSLRPHDLLVGYSDSASQILRPHISDEVDREFECWMMWVGLDDSFLVEDIFVILIILDFVGE